MSKKDTSDELPAIVSIDDQRQSVTLDPSSPSVRSIARVVVITLMLVFVASYVQAVISSLGYVFLLAIVSIFFAYLMDPLVSLIRRPFKDRGIERLMPRSLAIIVSYVLVFTILGIAISNIAPRVVDQAKGFGSGIPALGASVRERLNELDQRFDALHIPEDVQTRFNDEIVSIGQVVTAVVAGFVIAMAPYVPWFILVPIIAFFFLKDGGSFRTNLLEAFPDGPARRRTELILKDVDVTLAAYTRAQIISCVLIGLICAIGFYVLGLKYALLLGIVAGILEFVPMLGPAVAGVLVTTYAAFSDDPWKALYTAIFLIILRIAQDYFFYPRIVRGGIHLHPLTIILAIIAGEQVAGIPGVFLSIPVVAVLIVIVRHLREHQGQRKLLSGLVDEDDIVQKETA